MTGPKTQRIRQLNDYARQTLTGCRVLITPGVRALDATVAILDMLQQYSDFTPDCVNTANQAGSEQDSV